jgi:hypothetical protein
VTVGHPVVLDPNTRLSFSAFLDITSIGKERPMRGVLVAGRDIIGDKAVDITGVIVAGRSIRIHQDSKLAKLILFNDHEPPVITIVSPSGTDILGTTLPPIEITYTDAGSGVAVQSLQVTLDGAALTCSAGPAAATCQAPPQPEGLHSLVVRLRDLAGNPAIAERGVRTVSDMTPPTVTFLAPANGATLNTLTPQIAASLADVGSGIDTVSVHLVVDGIDVTSEAAVTPTGVTWTPAEPLAELAHTAAVEVRDLVGHPAMASIAFAVDATPPVLAVEAPADGLLLNGEQVEVAGQATDENAGLRVEVNGQPATLTDDRFQVTMTLVEGSQTLTVRALDAAGNSQQEARQVIRFTLPEVAIASPADLSYVAATTVTVSGTVSDPAATVVVNGVPASVSGSSFTAADVPLVEGGNILTATVRDALGHVGTDSVNVVRDLTAPQILIHDPEDAAKIYTPTLTVYGMINDIVAGTVNASEATVTVNGRPATVANRSFVVAGLPLTPGENVITAIAADQSGNQSEDSITVFLEAAGVARLAPASGDLQQGVVSLPLPQPLVVSVLDAAGQPVAGRPVLFSVRDGDGSFADGKRQVAVATGADGRASAGFTLGSRAGAANQVIEASAVGFAGPAVFHASARTGDAKWILVDSGALQVGIAGQPLPQPLVAVVTDAGFNRLAGVDILLRMITGDGHFADDLPETVVTTDSDGRIIVPFTLGPEEGITNNVVEATIAGIDPSPKASFVATGRVAGDPAATSISGIVFDNMNQPVPGVTLRVKEQPQLTAVADAKGLFRIAGAPVGTVHLIVDGSTADCPGSWPDLEFVLTTIAGRDNTVNMPIYLLPIDLAHGVYVDETRGGTVTLPDFPGFALEVKPGSVTFPGGSRSGVVSVTAVHGDKVPMVPNFGQQPRFIVTIQPAGARFDPPARLVLPNLEALAPGQVTEMYSFDHDLGHFVSIGPGTVSDDGLVIVSNPGVGVIKAGWHCGGNPSTSGTPHCCAPCQICDGSTCVPGCPLPPPANASQVAEGLAAIFAGEQGCNCTDNNPCTINDRCDGRGGCIGTPVQVTAISGACAAPPDTSMAFTATSNAPPQVKWSTSPAGTPPTGQGGSFSTRWSTTGGKMVSAACGQNVLQRKSVRIFQRCSGGVTTPTVTNATPTIPGSELGYFEGSPPEYSFAPCTDSVGNQYCLKLTRFESSAGYAVASRPGVGLVESANDPIVTAATCGAILRNITPGGSGYDGRPSLALYWSRAIMERHEQKHAQDWRDLVLNPTLNEFSAWLASKCQGCDSPPSPSDVQAKFDEIYGPKLQEFERVKEGRAYDQSNAEFQALADAIKARALLMGWSCQ